jgi:hypothetical protein
MHDYKPEFLPVIDGKQAKPSDFQIAMPQSATQGT